MSRSFGPRRAVWIEIDQADESVASDASIDLLTKFDLIYRTLVAIQFNFSQSGHPGGSVSAGQIMTAALFGTMVVLLAFAFTLEQWPARRRAPSFSDTLAVGPDALAFARGEVRVRPDEMIGGPGAAALLVRSGNTLASLPMTVGGEGVLRVSGLRPFVLRPTGTRVDLPLRPYHVVHGRDGRRAVFAQMDLTIEGLAVLRPAPGAAAGPDAPGAEEERNREAADLVER